MNSFTLINLLFITAAMRGLSAVNPRSRLHSRGPSKYMLMDKHISPTDDYLIRRVCVLFARAPLRFTVGSSNERGDQLPPTLRVGILKVRGPLSRGINSPPRTSSSPPRLSPRNALGSCHVRKPWNSTHISVERQGPVSTGETP